MEVERTVFRQWQLEQVPAGSAVWVRGVGHLQGFGQSRRKMLLYELIPHIVITGRGTYKCEGQTISLKAGDLFTVWPGLAYEFYEAPDDPWQFYWFYVEGKDREAFGHACGFRPDRLTLSPRHPERLLKTLRQMFEYYGRSPSLRDPFHALSLLHRFTADLRAEIGLNDPVQESVSGQAELVNDAMALAEALLDTGINVNELAHRLSTSRNSLLVAFRNQLNKSPQQYLSELRLSRAEDLLSRTNWTIRTVADACGFHNEKYFMQVFKRQHGLTPTSWRKKHP